MIWFSLSWFNFILVDLIGWYFCSGAISCIHIYVHVSIYRYDFFIYDFCIGVYSPFVICVLFQVRFPVSCCQTVAWSTAWGSQWASRCPAEVASDLSCQTSHQFGQRQVPNLKRSPHEFHQAHSKMIAGRYNIYIYIYIYIYKI